MDTSAAGSSLPAAPSGVVAVEYSTTDHDDGWDQSRASKTIFSRSDLTFNGSGSLTVTADQNHGISSKDDLKIVSGILTVNAARDGLRSRDCIGVRDGTIAVDSADGWGVALPRIRREL